MELTWADKMMEKGRQKGLREGKGKTLAQLLSAKFGTLPPETISRIEGLESVEELDRSLERVLTAGSIEEMGL